jgi:hypothetical protein
VRPEIVDGSMGTVVISLSDPNSQPTSGATHPQSIVSNEAVKVGIRPVVLLCKTDQLAGNSVLTAKYSLITSRNSAPPYGKRHP